MCQCDTMIGGHYKYPKACRCLKPHFVQHNHCYCQDVTVMDKPHKQCCMCDHRYAVIEAYPLTTTPSWNTTTDPHINITSIQ